jgi:ABC-type phosphonate transport system ATPase subunit
VSPGDGKPQTGLLLRASGVTQVYGGNVALSDVDFDLRAGEMHALFGENGACKSTLIKVLTGKLRPDPARLRSMMKHMPSSVGARREPPALRPSSRNLRWRRRSASSTTCFSAAS